jgi:hypothetical protein
VLRAQGVVLPLLQLLKLSSTELHVVWMRRNVLTVAQSLLFSSIRCCILLMAFCDGALLHICGICSEGGHFSLKS